MTYKNFVEMVARFTLSDECAQSEDEVGDTLDSLVRMARKCLEANRDEANG